MDQPLQSVVRALTMEPLIPGEEAFYTAKFNLTQDVVDSGGLSNQATITANSPGVSDPLRSVI